MPEPLKVLISVIGDPREYKPVRYHYGDFPPAISNFSSLVLLDAVKPGRAVLIGQYTLAERGGSFEDLQKETIEAISRRINDVGRFTDVIIAPGVIRKRDKVSGREFNYRGDIFNFYVYTLYRLARIFEGLDGDLDVTLDLTHGINYMGYLTLTAVNLILNIYSLRSSVKLRVVNSDPYPRGREYQAPPDLNINKVLEGEVMPTFNYPISLSIEVLHPYSGGDEDKAELGKRLRNELSDEMRQCIINQAYFINAVSKGTLLAAYTFADEFEKCVDFSVRYFEDNIVVSDDDKSFTVEPKYSFTRTFESLVIAEMMRRITGISRRSEVELSELDRKSEIYNGKNMVLYTIIKNEINDIGSKINEAVVRSDRTLNTESWIKLSQYMDVLQIQYSKDPDMRTFYAHAGMPYVFVEVKGATKELRYSSDALEKVRSFLSH